MFKNTIVLADFIYFSIWSVEALKSYFLSFKQVLVFSIGFNQGHSKFEYVQLIF